jgi:carbon monoxide dehydrogenase subunit G
MLKKLVIAVVVILAVILGLAAIQPDTFTVTRSITIKAPPEKIIPLVNDFRNWKSWSPWENLDPNMQRTFSGAASGTGAVYAWQGNSDVGKGRMEITGQELPFKVTVKLEFIEPIASTNITDFALVPKGELTTVNWTMNGPMMFITKIMGVFTSMDKMIGKDFEKGLAQMKAVAEK